MYFKKELFFLFFSILALNVFAEKQGSESSSLYSKHWYGKQPFRETKKKNPLLIYDLFIISFDLETRFPDWVAYNLSPSILWGGLREKRDYKKDPYLSFKEGLRKEDYKGISSFAYDRGHFAPLGSFKGSVFAYQAQYLSNIVPQKRDLNQGPWRLLEEAVRRFSLKGHEVRVLTGPLYGNPSKGKSYGKPVPPWPKLVGKISQLPSGFWKMLAFKEKSKIQVCSFVMPQKVRSRKTSPKKYISSLKDLKKYTGLIFFRGLKSSIKEDCGFLF